MRNSGKTMGRLGKLAMVVAIIATALLSLAGVAGAATPAWKLLAVTGPTNLPPRQSEIQRVTVEAEGGTFTLTKPAVEAEATPVFDEVTLGLTAGSGVATIETFGGHGTVEPGDRVSTPGGLEQIRITACSTDCTSVGSTITLSEPAAATETGALRQIYTRELEGATRRFLVGEEIERTTFGGGIPFEYLPPGTTVTAVDGSTITLSATTGEYDKEEGAIEIVTPSKTTPPIPSDASASVVGGALAALYGAGTVSVTGGPGGSGATPYLVTFDGPALADTDVGQLEIDGAGLEGADAGADVSTTVPGGDGTGALAVTPTNLGGAPTLGTYTLRIGPLPPGIQVSGATRGSGWNCPEAAGEASLTCTSQGRVPATTPAETLTVPVRVVSGMVPEATVPIQVSGGGAGSATYDLAVKVSPDRAPYGVAAFWAGSFDAEGNLETQAGAHPYSAQTFFMLNSVRAGDGQIVPAGTIESAEAELPPGFSGDPLVTARCPQGQLVGQLNSYPLCNDEMIAGELAPFVGQFGNGAKEFIFPIYNDVPAPGAAAEFTTKIAFPTQSLLGSVRSGGDFGVTVGGENIANNQKIYGTYVALDGEPAAAHGKAFLGNPSDCAEQARSGPVVNLVSRAYEQPPGVTETSTAPIPPVTGCEKLHFQPSFTFAPSTTQGSSPSGATAVLDLPQAGLTDPAQLAEPPLKKAVVTLPQGLTVNPSSANGLGACTEAQVGYVGPGAMPNPTRFDEEPVTCPDASKLGTFTVRTPLLDEEEPGGRLEGTIYLAAQEENPFHSLIALYLVLENERYGLTLKLPGKVDPDPATGQLTATFDDNPQLPFEDLTLNFRGGGPRSTLATPEVCGTYRTTGSIEPWSAPESGPPAQIEEGGFDIASGCSSSASTRPFAPGLEAGTTGTQAGAYSPLVIKVTRKDGEQELKSLDFTLPKGLIAKLAGIPYCPASAIGAAEGRSGRAEQASASCPAASQIGTVDTSAGVGPEPIHVGGKVYLAGPYEGAPLSSVVVTPAVAGPFDLGDVVIRAPLYIDPETAEVTAKSDPIPTILRGIPLKVRSVAIDLDRSLFTLNPTSCDPMEVTSTMQGSSGATAKPANRFQVGGCDKLAFRPQLKISLKGPTGRGGLPALKAVVTYPEKGAYADIRRAQVNLPHSEFLEQDNLDKTCTRPVLLEGKCPGSTIYGRAKAWTPLLDEPLQGPVYLVGGYGYKLPALVADLDGQIRVVLKGKVDSGPNKGIRNTFEAVPDAPVSRFVLEMKGGRRYGLLVNSEDLCRKPRHAIVRFTAQNGLARQWKPRIADSCGKKGSRHKKKRSKGHHHKKHRSA